MACEGAGPVGKACAGPAEDSASRCDGMPFVWIESMRLPRIRTIRAHIHKILDRSIGVVEASLQRPYDLCSFEAHLYHILDRRLECIPG